MPCCALRYGSSLFSHCIFLTVQVVEGGTIRPGGLHPSYKAGHWHPVDNARPKPRTSMLVDEHRKEIYRLSSRMRERAAILEASATPSTCHASHNIKPAVGANDVALSDAEEQDSEDSETPPQPKRNFKLESGACLATSAPCVKPLARRAVNYTLPNPTDSSCQMAAGRMAHFTLGGSALDVVPSQSEVMSDSDSGNSTTTTFEGAGSSTDAREGDSVSEHEEGSKTPRQPKRGVVPEEPHRPCLQVHPVSISLRSDVLPAMCCEAPLAANCQSATPPMPPS